MHVPLELLVRWEKKRRKQRKVWSQKNRFSKIYESCLVWLKRKSKWKVFQINNTILFLCWIDSKIMNTLSRIPPFIFAQHLKLFLTGIKTRHVTFFVMHSSFILGYYDRKPTHQTIISVPKCAQGSLFLVFFTVGGTWCGSSKGNNGYMKRTSVEITSFKSHFLIVDSRVIFFFFLRNIFITMVAIIKITGVEIKIKVG